MRYHVSHLTTYEYHASVSLSQHQMRLRPRDCRHQVFSNHKLEIEPAPRDICEYLDYFGNPALFATLEGAHSRLAVRSEFDVEVTGASRPSPSETPAWENVREMSRGFQLGSALEAAEFLF